VISGMAVDKAGNTATASVTLNIDKIPPVFTLTSPINGTTVSTSPVTVTGTVADALSGVFTATCNGLPASLNGTAVSCVVPLVAGPNSIDVVVTDVAGNSSTSPLSVVLTGITGPVISDFNPKSGPAGTVVTVTGSSLAATSGTPQVTLNRQGGGAI